MIEIDVLNYLKSKTSVPVYTETQTKMPSKYIIIEKTGSSREDYIDKPIITIKSVSTSMYEAAKLNEEVKEMIFDSIGYGGIGGVRLNSDYNYTDTTTKTYRYCALFMFTYHSTY